MVRSRVGSLRFPTRSARAYFFGFQALAAVNFLGKMIKSRATGARMLRYKLKELIADKEFRERRRVTVQELAQATGITRNTLSKMLNQHGASVRSENLARLCAYFDCRIEQLLEYVPDVAVDETFSDQAARSASQ
jgi:putative transcriptional regulator